MKITSILAAFLFLLAPLGAMSVNADHGPNEEHCTEVTGVFDAGMCLEHLSTLGPQGQLYDESNPIVQQLYADGGPLAVEACGITSGDPVWDALCHAVFMIFPDATFAEPFPDNPSTPRDEREDYHVDADGHLDDDEDGRKDVVNVVDDPDLGSVFIQLDFFFDRQGTTGHTAFYNPELGAADFDYGLQPMLYNPEDRQHFQNQNHDGYRVASTLVRGDYTFSPAIYDARLADDGILFCYLCVEAATGTFATATYVPVSNTGAQGAVRYETIFDFDIMDDSIEERSTHSKSILRMESQWIYEDGQQWNDAHETVIFGEKHVKVDDDTARSATLQDMDDDGDTDYEEQECNSNPTRWQSTCDDWDGDGVSNDIELADPARSPYQDDDFDKDGIFNPVDNCNPGQQQTGSPAWELRNVAGIFPTANSDQNDLDGDGLGDVCESDIDGDGAANLGDAFPYCDQGTADTDGDGKANVRLPGNGACDFTLYPGGLVEDLNDDNHDVNGGGDTHLDVDDNCPTVVNQDQANLDAALAAAGNRHVTPDGLGDACDPDDDGDGLTAVSEGAAADRLPDRDLDGLSDKQEVDDNAGTDSNADPGLRDTDSDLLTDCQEVFHTVVAECEDPTFTGPFDGGYGTDANSADTDEDGISDKDEVDAGTDPLDPLDPFPVVVPLLPNPINVLFNTECDYVAKGGEDYDEEECGAIVIEGPQTFLDDADVYDTDGDGDIFEPNGQIDQIETRIFFYDDAADDEGGQTEYTQRFKGDGTMSFVFFEDPLGPPGSPHRNAHIVSFGDAAATTTTEMIIVETSYEEQVAGRGESADPYTYGFTAVWCLLMEDGAPVVYTGTQRFNEPGAEHPCGQNYAWTDSANEASEEWTYAVLRQTTHFFAGKDPGASFIRFVDEDRNQVPEKVIVQIPDIINTPVECASASLLGPCAIFTVEQDLTGVPDPGSLCEDPEASPPGCLVGGNPVDDRDMDDVPDAVDDCPDDEGPVDNGGCPVAAPDPEGDDDGDGVPNADDECPGTPEGVPVDEEGCEGPGALGDLDDLCDDGGTFPECVGDVPDPNQLCEDPETETFPACVAGEDPFAAVEGALGVQPDCSDMPRTETLYICRRQGETVLSQATGGLWPGYTVRIAGILDLDV